MKVGVAIVYSSIDSFLWPMLRRQVESFADQIVAVSRTHLFSGEEEPAADLGVNHVLLPWKPGPGGQLCQEMRLVGLQQLRECDRVLFLDSDELIDVERMKPSLTTAVPTYFAAEWYWRDPTVKAVQKNEVAGLYCRPEDVLANQKRGEREAMCEKIQRPRPEHPFMHHFSWCKPLDAMLKKVANWGHRNDHDDWAGEILREWTAPLPGDCSFVHRNRQLVRCQPPFP